MLGSWLRGRAPGVAVAVAVLVLAGSGAAPMVGPVDARGCPDQPLSVADLQRLQGDDGLLILADVNHAGRRCYGSAPIRIVAFSGAPPIMGWEGPWYLEPGWLGDIGLALYDSAVTRDEWKFPSYRLAWHGSHGALQARYLREWVVVTAHFDDPAARTCHATGTGRPTRASLVRECRSVLVIESVRSLGQLDTATAPLVPARDGVPVAVAGLALALSGLLGGVAWLGRARRESKRPGR